MRDHLVQMAGYNAWANRRLYAAARALADAEYRADRRAFFRSLHGTLNHLFATDRIWMRRFTGQGEAPNRLDAILHEDLDGLERARIAEDARICAYVAGLDEAALAGVIHYVRVSAPQPIAQPLGSGLAHLFNHQTHHRGQAHAILTGLGRDAPALDLLFYQREVGTA